MRLRKEGSRNLRFYVWPYTLAPSSSSLRRAETPETPESLQAPKALLDRFTFCHRLRGVLYLLIFSSSSSSSPSLSHPSLRCSSSVFVCFCLIPILVQRFIKVSVCVLRLVCFDRLTMSSVSQEDLPHYQAHLRPVFYQGKCLVLMCFSRLTISSLSQQDITTQPKPT